MNKIAKIILTIVGVFLALSLWTIYPVVYNLEVSGFFVFLMTLIFSAIGIFILSYLWVPSRSQKPSIPRSIGNFVLIVIGTIMAITGISLLLPDPLFGIGLTLISFGVLNFRKWKFWKKALISIAIGLILHLIFDFLGMFPNGF